MIITSNTVTPFNLIYKSKGKSHSLAKKNPDKSQRLTLFDSITVWANISSHETPQKRYCIQNNQDETLVGLTYTNTL